MRPCLFVPLVGLSALIAGCAARTEIVADEEIAVYATVDHAVAGRTAIATLPRGAHAVVVDCVDVKHFLVLEIEAGSKPAGFITSGGYTPAVTCE